MFRFIRNTKGVTLIEAGLVLGIGGATMMGVATYYTEAQEAIARNSLSPVETSAAEDVDALIDRLGTKAPSGSFEPEQISSSGLPQWDLAADLPRDGASDRQISVGSGVLGYLEFGDTDAYWLNMPEAGDVVITLQGRDHGAGAAGDPDLILRSVSGEVIERGGSEGGERISATLDTGRYLIQAKLYGAETGHYELRVAGIGAQ